MKDSLLTARWAVDAAPPDYFEGLPFRASLQHDVARKLPAV